MSRYLILNMENHSLLRTTRQQEFIAPNELIVDVSDWPREAIMKYIKPNRKTNNSSKPRAKPQSRISRIESTTHVAGVHDFMYLSEEKRSALKEATGRTLIDLLAEVGVSTCCDDKAKEIINKAIQHGTI